MAFIYIFLILDKARQEKWETKGKGISSKGKGRGWEKGELEKLLKWMSWVERGEWGERRGKTIDELKQKKEVKV